MKRSFIRENIIVASNLTKLGCAFLRQLRAIRQGVWPVSSLSIRHSDEKQLRDRGLKKKSIPFGGDSEQDFILMTSKGSSVPLKV